MHEKLNIHGAGACPDEEYTLPCLARELCGNCEQWHGKFSAAMNNSDCFFSKFLSYCYQKIIAAFLPPAND
jgi:hypothetical protein